MIGRIVLIATLGLGVVIPAIGLSLAVDGARKIGVGDGDFVAFIGATAITGGTAVAVGVAILWHKRGNTLVVAALFQRLRRRLQRALDRRLDRARVDADLTSAGFSERLRDEVDIVTVTADLDRTVRASLKPANVGLWLREPPRATE
jgi:hypothetical protein